MIKPNIQKIYTRYMEGVGVIALADAYGMGVVDLHNKIKLYANNQNKQRGGGAITASTQERKRKTGIQPEDARCEEDCGMACVVDRPQVENQKHHNVN